MQQQAQRVRAKQQSASVMDSSATRSFTHLLQHAANKRLAEKVYNANYCQQLEQHQEELGTALLLSPSRYFQHYIHGHCLACCMLQTA